MISSHGVTEVKETACILDWGNSGGCFSWHSLEEGRVMDVGRVLGPGEEGALRSLKVVPSLVSCKSVRVEFTEKSGGDD